LIKQASATMSQASSNNSNNVSGGANVSSSSSTTTTTTSGEDTAKAVQLLLETMQGRFQQLSDRIISRIDDMGNRIDDLERSIAVLMKEGEENRSGASTTTGTIMSSPSGKLTTGTNKQ
jgi:heat shock factor-binding protein 1